MTRYSVQLALSLLLSLGLNAQKEQLALVKYNGGGDWYANPTALYNLAEFCNESINTNLQLEPVDLELNSAQIFNYPFLHLTGHGNIVLSEEERLNLRLYLEAGGFIHIDDNYGMDPYIRREIEALFENRELQLLSKDHPIFQAPFSFPEGLPKIHEHDAKAPEAWAIFIEGRLALLYTHEADLGDGWEDQEVHNDPEELRLKALQMGANIIHHAFNQAL